jgi:hypothetical protein
MEAEEDHVADVDRFLWEKLTGLCKTLVAA